MSDEFDKEEEFVGSGDSIGIIELDDDIVDPEIEVPDIESEFGDDEDEKDPDDLGLDLGDPMD